MLLESVFKVVIELHAFHYLPSLTLHFTLKYIKLEIQEAIKMQFCSETKRNIKV